MKYIKATFLENPQIQINNTKQERPKKLEEKKRGNASIYHLTKPLPSLARTSAAAAAYPSVDSASTLFLITFSSSWRQVVGFGMRGK